MPDARLSAADTGQAFRLARYREQHPGVIVEAGQFGTWQARIPEPRGEQVYSRHTLRELLDRLEALAHPVTDPDG